VRLEPDFCTAYTKSCAVPQPQSVSMVIRVPGAYLCTIWVHSEASLLDGAAVGAGA
jgi:hypothetical protein